jgi:hypothetical protein
MRHKALIFSILVFCTMVSVSIKAQNEQTPAIQETTQAQSEWIRIITPLENAQIISKKPAIKAELLVEITPKSLIVLVDGTDITQLVKLTEKEVSYAPFMVLAPGIHTITIMASGKDGKQLQKNIIFISRHTNAIEEVYTSHDGTLMFQTVAKKPESDLYTPKNKVDGNFKEDTKLRNKNWEFLLTTNVRALGQSGTVSPPLKEGVDLPNLLVTGSYLMNNVQARVSIGDLQINETQYSVSNLSRKGALIGVGYTDDFQLTFFTVKSQQQYGVEGIGVSTNENKQIMGVTGGLKFLNKKMELKTVIMSGGEPGSSMGIYTSGGAKKGNLLGVILVSDFFSNKFKTEFETDFAKFDPDTSDEFKSKSDRAYSFKASGMFTKYNYEIFFERIGSNYGSIGNQSLQKDKLGIGVRNGFNLGVHNLNVVISRYYDNLLNEPLLPRITNFQSTVDYSYSKFARMPLRVSYLRSNQASSHEPEGSYPLDMTTNTIMGNINFIKDNFNVGFQTSYSMLDDATPAKTGSRAVNVTIIQSRFFLQSLKKRTDVDQY